MSHPPISNEEMLSRIVRYPDAYTKENAVPAMFIDSILPGHHRLNYAVAGDTASENPDYNVLLAQPHKFQLGMFRPLPGAGPAYHTHDYVEVFLPLEGEWRFYWGNDAEAEPDGEVFLSKWDLISFPPGLWRGFEVVSAEPAWCFAVLESHQVFEGKDPYWAPKVIRQAAERGFASDDFGRMIKPDNFDEINRQMLDHVYDAKPLK